MTAGDHLRYTVTVCASSVPTTVRVVYISHDNLLLLLLCTLTEISEIGGPPGTQEERRG